MASKYIKERKNTKPEKEIKEEKSSSKADKKTEYRSSVITPKRARELMLEEERRAAEEAARAEQGEAQAEEEIEEAVTEEAEAASEVSETAEAPAEEEKPERLTYRGSSTDMFRDEGNTQEKEILYNIESAEVTGKSVRSRAITRMLICSAVLTVIASLIQLFAIHVPFTPRLFTVEFSVIPELIASIAYGPICGIVICVIKNIVHVAIAPSSAISAFNNLLSDSVFLLITALLYASFMHSSNRKRWERNKGEKKLYSPTKVFISSIAGAAITIVPQFFITRFVAFPLYEKFYSADFSMAELLVSYQAGLQGLLRRLPERVGALLPQITSVTRGVLVFNLPVTFAKLIISSVISAIILRITISFLHSTEK